MARALILGASGFIGGALARHLAATGDEVVGLSRRPAGRGGACRWLPLADPADAAALAAILAAVAPDTVFHLAGSAAAPSAEQRSCSIALTRALLRAAAARPRPPAVLLVGSAAEYGELPAEALPATEGLVCRPATPYGRAKLAQTRLGLAAAAAGLPVVMARLFNVIGPGLPGHLALGRFARSLAAMPPGGVLATGPLDAERDFVALEDAVRVLAGLARTPAAIGQVVNVCSGRAVRMERLVRDLVRISGRRARIAIDPGRHGISAVPRMVGSPARLAALGLAVAVPDFEAALGRLWDAAAAQPAAAGTESA
jgi:GDP-4-dehydro-6-deoxy-D-mannose reductase